MTQQISLYKLISMKKLSLLVSAFICCSLLKAQTVYPSGVSGCIARWTFDTTEVATLTNLPDVSGNGNSGTVYNISSIDGFRNKPNRAGGFDGSTSWAEVMHDTMLTPSEMTIISLVKFNGFNSALCEGNQIISKGQPYFVAGNWGQGVGDNSGCGTYSPTTEAMITQAGSFAGSFPNPNYIQTNKWYFLASIITSDSMAQYQVMMDTANKAASLTPMNYSQGTYTLGTNTQNVSIGKHLNPNYPYWVNGAMDEVILFNKALTNQEVYNIYSYLWGWPVEVSSVQEEPTISLYHHHGVLNISSDLNNYHVAIFNIQGQKLVEKNNCSFNEAINLNTSCPTFVMVKITNGNKSTVIKKMILSND